MAVHGFMKTQNKFSNANFLNRYKVCCQNTSRKNTDMTSLTDEPETDPPQPGDKDCKAN